MLEELDVCECDYEPHLDSLILQQIGLDDDDDRVFEKYCDIMEKRSKKINSDQDITMKQVFKAYHEIMNIKKSLAKA